MRKTTNLSRLMEYAGKHRYLTYTSWILSALSALMALVPFWYIWKIIKEVLEVAPDFERAENLVHNGWMAVLIAVLWIALEADDCVRLSMSPVRLQKTIWRTSFRIKQVL